MRRWLALPVVTLAMLSARPAGAEDPKTYTVPTRETWKVNEVVSRKDADKKVKKQVVKGADGAVIQQGETEEVTTYEGTLKVLEVDAEGAYTKALVHFTTWSQKVGEAEDTTLTGKHVEVSGTVTARAFKVVTPGAEVSPEAIEWLDEEFGKGATKNEAIRMTLVPREPLAIGGAWDADPAALAKAFNDEKGSIVQEKSSAKVTLKEVKDGVALLEVVVSLQMGTVNTPFGPLEWKEGGVLGTHIEGTRALDAGVHGLTSKVSGGLKGVMVDGQGRTVDFEMQLEGESVVTAGGEMPAVPAAK